MGEIRLRNYDLYHLLIIDYIIRRVRLDSRSTFRGTHRSFQDFPVITLLDDASDPSTEYTGAVVLAFKFTSRINTILSFYETRVY